jgi:hypothetical protein
MPVSSRPLKRHAARHLDHRTIDVAGFVAGQKGVDVGDFFGLGVILLIIRLEKKGVVHRLGVEEDANR